MCFIQARLKFLRCQKRVWNLLHLALQIVIIVAKINAAQVPDSGVRHDKRILRIRPRPYPNAHNGDNRKKDEQYIFLIFQSITLLCRGFAASSCGEKISAPDESSLCCAMRSRVSIRIVWILFSNPAFGGSAVQYSATSFPSRIIPILSG